MNYARRLDLLVGALRRATPFGRERMLATHRRLCRKRIHLPPVPEGYRVVAGELVAQPQTPTLAGRISFLLNEAIADDAPTTKSQSSGSPPRPRSSRT